VLELIEKETVSQADMARLCARVQKRQPFAPFNGFGKRRPSDRPPVLTPAEKGLLKASAEADGVRAQANGSSTVTDTLTGPGTGSEYGAPGRSPGLGSTDSSAYDPHTNGWDGQH